jgi:hypothetical protein
MLTTDADTWQQGCVDVERNSARKVLYNARGVVGLRCNLNLRHYYKTHFRQLAEATMSIRVSVFHNSKFLFGGNTEPVRQRVDEDRQPSLSLHTIMN